MPQRKYNKEREQVTKINKRVILLILLQGYNKCAEASESFRTMVDEMIELYPELLPDGIASVYRLHDRLPVSKKLASDYGHLPGVGGASFPCFARTQARCPAVRHVYATFMPR